MFIEYVLKTDHDALKTFFAPFVDMLSKLENVEVIRFRVYLVHQKDGAG